MQEQVRRILLRVNAVRATVRGISALYYLGPLRSLFIRRQRSRARGRALPAGAQAVSMDLDVPLASARLAESGFSGTFRIRRDVTEEIAAYVSGLSPDNRTNPHERCEAIRLVAHDPHVLDVVRRFLGVDPILYGTIAMVADVGDTAPVAAGATCQREFHYDVSDFKALTMFVYLNDVDASGGAHIVIPSSNRRLTVGRVLSRFIPYQQALRRFGADGLVTVVGETGTAFLEDLVNFHKRSATNRRRSALSVTYTLSRRP